MKEKIKEIIIAMSALAGIFITILGAVILYVLVVSLPFIIIIWTVWKLFFNQQTIEAMKLIPQSKKLIKEMIEAGYPTCLKKGDWSGNYPRHCNTCIKNYKKLNKL